MKTIAVITARGGSKRIPRKNIKNFMGKPMLAYAIEACLNSGIFEEVMVSTDDQEIAQIAKEYGAAVPFMRSEKTSNDFANTYDVLEEVVLEYKKNGKEIENFCCVYPCVPFLTGEILKNAFENFVKDNVETLVPVVKFSFPIQRAFKVNQEGLLEYREPENALARSQDLDPMFHDVGMFYFLNTAKLLENKKIVGSKVSYIEMDESRVQDIDNDEDWKMAEMKYRILNNA